MWEDPGAQGPFSSSSRKETKIERTVVQVSWEGQTEDRTESCGVWKFKNHFTVFVSKSKYYTRIFDFLIKTWEIALSLPST